MHVEQISFRYLMTLCVLHETGSMRKTATLLRRTQPAISLQIKSLERIVGFDVVEHTRGRIAFTRRGTQLALQARGLIADMNQMVEDVATSTDESIRVGVTEDFFRRGMKDISNTFDEPWIDVQVEASDVLVQNFLGGGLDIALAKSVTPLKSATRAWQHEPAWAGHSCGSPGTRGMELVLLSEKCLYHQLAVAAFEKSARTYSVRSICSSWDVVFHALHRGGLTVVSREWPGEAPLCHENDELPTLPSASINLLVNHVGPRRRRDECEQLVARISQRLGFLDHQRLV